MCGITPTLGSDRKKLLGMTIYKVYMGYTPLNSISWGNV